MAFFLRFFKLELMAKWIAIPFVPERSPFFFFNAVP